MYRRTLLSGLGASIVSVAAAGAATATRPRVAVGAVHLADRGDGTAEQGERITVSPRIDNLTDRWRYVRTVITVDGDAAVRGPLAIAPDGSEWYGREFALDRAGDYAVGVAAQVWNDGGWVTADTAERSVAVEGDAARRESDGGGATASNRVVGYYPSWGRYDGYGPDEAPLSKLTHLLYAFLDVESDGTVVYGDPEGDPRNLARFAERNRDAEASLLLSIGGWSYSDAFSDAALTAERRRRFADTAVGLMREYGFDGIDVDWEYPGGGGAASNAVREGDPHRFTLLLRAVRDRLDEAEAADGRTYELSFAAPAGKVARYEAEPLAEVVDFVNVMTYDMAGGWLRATDHNAPLADSGGPASSSVSSGMRRWAETAFSRASLTVGVPFYGRTFDGASDANDGLFQPFSAQNGAIGYDEIRSQYAADPSYAKHRDSAASVPWLYSEADARFVTYDDPRSVRRKAAFADAEGYGGTMIWELSHDPDETLLDAVRDA